MGVARKEQRMVIASPGCQNTFLTKNCTKFLYFFAQNPAREAYSGHAGLRRAPPPKKKKSASSKKNSWLRLIAYVASTFTHSFRIQETLLRGQSWLKGVLLHRTCRFFSIRLYIYIFIFNHQYGSIQQHIIQHNRNKTK